MSLKPDNKSQDSPGHSDQKDDKHNKVVESVFGQERQDKVRSNILSVMTNQNIQSQTQKNETKKAEKAAETEEQVKSKRFSIFDLTKNDVFVGIDLGSRFLKIVELVLSHGQFNVNKLILEELPVRTRKNPAEDQTQIKNFINNILKKNEIRGKAYLSIPMEDVQIKMLKFPPMPSGEISDAVKLEIARDIKNNIDDVSYDFLILGNKKNEKSNTTHILAVVVPKQLILQKLNMFHSTGLKILAIEPDILSLISCLHFNRNIKDEDNLLLLDVGHYTTNLSIIVKKELRYNKSIRINGSSITSAISDYSKISIEEAEKLLWNSHVSIPAQHDNDHDFKNEANQSQVNDKFKIAVSMVLEKLAAEVERTFKYYSYEISKSEIISYNRILLTGGMANFPLIKQYLEKRLNAPIEVLNLLENLTISKNSRINKKSLNNPFIFAAALGLALRHSD